MSTPIQPAAPVSPIITIQAVASIMPNHEGESPLNALPSGTSVEGFVVNRDGQNNPILRTVLGDLKVTSDVFLKTGSTVIFKVDTSQASLARIISVDGLTPQDYNTQNLRSGLTADTISNSLLPSTQLPSQLAKPGAPTTTLQALILQSTQQTAAKSSLSNPLFAAQLPPSPLMAQLAQLRPGAPVRLALFDIKLPPLPISIAELPDSKSLDGLMPPRPQTATPAASSNASPTTTLIASGSTPAGETPVTTKMPNEVTASLAGNQSPATDELAPLATNITQRQQAATATTFAQVTPAALLTANDFQAARAKPTPQQHTSYPHTAATTAVGAFQPSRAANVSIPTGNQLLAQVIGHDADGANILHTPFATLKLYTAQSLPTGTTLLVEASPETNIAPAPPSKLAVEEKFFSNATRDWKSLDDAISWLKDINPDMAREVTARLPVAGHKLASGLLFFVAALKNGDVSELLGKRVTRLLEASAPELLKKLRMDMGQIRSNLVDSPLDHWSSVALPIMFGQELQQAQLFISKEPPDGEQESPDNSRGQRFILEVGMSELGPIQFDGFVRRPLEQRQSFDLMVRSAALLDEQLSQGIRGIFESSLSVTGMRGQVIFQTGIQHFVRPLTEQKPPPGTQGHNTILA